MNFLTFSVRYSEVTIQSSAKFACPSPGFNFTQEDIGYENRSIRFPPTCLSGPHARHRYAFISAPPGVTANPSTAPVPRILPRTSVGVIYYDPPAVPSVQIPSPGPRQSTSSHNSLSITLNHSQSLLITLDHSQSLPITLSYYSPR